MERVEVQDSSTISLVECHDADQRAVDIMPHTAGSYLLHVYFQTNQPTDRQRGVFLSSSRLCCERHQALN